MIGCRCCDLFGPPAPLERTPLSDEEIEQLVATVLASLSPAQRAEFDRAFAVDVVVAHDPGDEDPVR